VAEKEFLSFDEALRELRLKEEELKRLVSEGEIRAFRDGETMKLRKTDVETLRAELQGGEVVDLGGASEELVFEDDTDLDAGMATEEISEADTILEEEVQEVTEEVELSEEAPQEEEGEPELVGAGARRGGRAVDMTVDEPYEGGGVRALLIFTTVLLMMGVPALLSHGRGTPTSIARNIAGMFGQKF
jgi:excisionase family DNA binding protein